MQKERTKKSGLSIMQAGNEGITYELTVVYAPNEVADLAEAVNATVKYATDAGFSVCSMDIDGKKTLAYPIRDMHGEEQAKGIFAYFILSGKGRPSELSEVLCADLRVLRHLLVKQQFNLKEYK